MVRLTVGHDCAVVWRHKKEGSATRRADDHSFPAEGTKGQFRSLLQNSFCPLASAKPVFLRGLVELGRDVKREPVPNVRMGELYRGACPHLGGN